MLKLPPQNLEAEESVLGALMIDKDAIIKVTDILAPGDFYKPAHGKIYTAILTLFEKHQPIDILSITNRLKEEGALVEVGGATYLTELIERVPSASHISHYASLVKEKKILRDLITASAEISEAAFSPQEDVEILLDGIEQKIFSISQHSIQQRFVPIKEQLQEAYERLEKLHQGGGVLRGVGTGFNLLDHYLSGLQKSDLIILGARPSLGKTALALDVARYAAVVEKRPVGVFSLEMAREQVIDRLIAAESQVPLWKLRTGRLSDDLEFEMIQAGLDVLHNAPIFIDDTPSPTVLQMKSMARRLQMEHGLGLLIVDYLQLIQPRTQSDNLVQQVTETSRSLKALARELNTPVLALSQLSRSVDKREIKVPRLSDLRESGCLSGDTLIVRADSGERISIKELAERSSQEPVPVFTMDEHYKIIARPMTKVFHSGRKMVYQLKTRSGRIIKASANHPFRSLVGWKRLDELKNNEHIAIIDNHYCGSALFKSGLGRERMTRVAAALPQMEVLKDLAISDICWDEVISIKSLGVEDVYDATVPGTHNFIANDIFVHNSLEQDSDVVLFIYRQDRDKLNPDPEEQNTAEIIIAKHRNGPLGSVRLKFDPEKVSFRNIDTTHTPVAI